MPPAFKRREELLRRLSKTVTWDVAIIGGGATGLGIALDAASRGLSVVLVERDDFAKGTSSRATKLLHGGVRYLAQGNISLVYEALRERTTILRNARHLASSLPFVIPVYSWWSKLFYWTGLTIYDLLARGHSLGPTELLDVQATVDALPAVRKEGLVGGIRYWDAQFDDARLALALARTSVAHGALAVNYCAAESLVLDAGKVVGLNCRDRETSLTYRVLAGCVINATGVWADTLRRQDTRGRGKLADPLISQSQGVHLVVGRDCVPGDHALMIPKTRDGRVLFAVPWMGQTLVGTTDTRTDSLESEPLALDAEVHFILAEVNRYLRKPLVLADIKSVWAGLRPLVNATTGTVATKTISREHVVEFGASGLVTVAGGKWTTYRAIAKDVLDRCEEAKLVPLRGACRTEELSLLGSEGAVRVSSMDAPSYGSERPVVDNLPGANEVLGGGLTEAMVRFAARYEYARTVEDVLARRARVLFLDAGKAVSLAPRVAALLEEETGMNPCLEEFLAMARRYQASNHMHLGGGNFFP